MPHSRFRANTGPRRRRRGCGGDREGAGDSRLEDLHAESVDHGIPVIVVRDDADWTRLAALARTAVAGAAADSVSGVRLGDMFAFANAVATMTNGATSIVDPTGHVVGYSTIPGQPIDVLRRESTLTLQERTVPALDADYKVVYSLNTAVFVEAHDDEGGRLAIAVRAGGELLGSIWVIDPGDERRQNASRRAEPPGAPGRPAHAARPFGCRLHRASQRRSHAYVDGRCQTRAIRRSPARARFGIHTWVRRGGVHHRAPPTGQRRRHPRTATLAPARHRHLQPAVPQRLQRTHRLRRIRDPALLGGVIPGRASSPDPGHRRLRRRSVRTPLSPRSAAWQTASTSYSGRVPKPYAR